MSAPVPLTVLAGFLGAGKTTLLKHLLENKQGLKIAVLVNDVASVNIDAKIVQHTGHDASVELQNGCVCCTLEEDMLKSVLSLCRQHSPDHVILECSGVAEPLKIAEIFNTAADAGMPVSRVCQLSNMVTVVDGRAFHSLFGSNETLAQRADLTGPAKAAGGKGGARRAVADLLMEQVEVADVVILNKCDTLEASQQDRLEASIQALNPTAAFHRVSFGKIDPAKLLPAKGHESGAAEKVGVPDVEDEGASGPEEAEKGCCASGAAGEGRHTTSFGLRNFVYLRREPFHPQRLAGVLDALQREAPRALAAMAGSGEGAGAGAEGRELAGVLRSKGWVWLRDRPHQSMYWAHAGLHFQLEPSDPWWATVDRDCWPADPATHAAIAKEVEAGGAEAGDRRQELVFIGCDMNQKAITALLDQALLREGEGEGEDPEAAPAAPPASEGEDLTGDGGVVKTVLSAAAGGAPGPSREQPLVAVHYVGSLAATGRVFDRSDRAADRPFTVEWGTGAVIPAWEVALGAMRVGERSRVACSARYAYGDAGSPPDIPPGAALVFEMELVAVRGAAVDPLDMLEVDAAAPTLGAFDPARDGPRTAAAEPPPLPKPKAAAVVVEDLLDSYEAFDPLEEDIPLSQLQAKAPVPASMGTGAEGAGAGAGHGAAQGAGNAGFGVAGEKPDWLLGGDSDEEEEAAGPAAPAPEVKPAATNGKSAATNGKAAATNGKSAATNRANPLASLMSEAVAETEAEKAPSNGHGHSHGTGHSSGHGHSHGTGHSSGHGHSHGTGHSSGHGHGHGQGDGDVLPVSWGAAALAPPAAGPAAAPGAGAKDCCADESCPDRKQGTKEDCCADGSCEKKPGFFKSCFGAMYGGCMKFYGFDKK